jgi:hypothetical protein
MAMDLLPINAYGLPIVQPSTASPQTLGIRQVDDPREAAIAVSPLAARNSPELRQSVGPRQSSSSAETGDDEERATVHGKEGSSTPRASKPRTNTGEEDDGDRGNTLDVTV